VHCPESEIRVVANRAAALTCTVPLLLLIMDYDYWSRGKVHRATIWASLFVVALQQVRDPLGHLAGVCLVGSNLCAFLAHLGVGGNGKISTEEVAEKSR
jgi:hypothetical protein